MTTQRLETISTMIKMSILTNGAIDFTVMNPTVKELLTLANKEPRLEGTVGMCGTPCNDSCSTCKTYLALAVEHFEEKETLCATCGGECVSYTAPNDEQEYWLCEHCYYGNDDYSDGGYGGLDWNESGYFD